MSAPRGWLLCHVAAALFAGGYWLWHEAYGLSRSPLDRYLEARVAALNDSFQTSEAALAALAADPLAVRAAARDFQVHCATCHGARGEGKVGPNLTDDRWLGGGAGEDIYRSIVEGRPARGMQPWGGTLGPAACKQLAAFLMTLRGRPQPGRPPEGAPWPPPGGGAR